MKDQWPKVVIHDDDGNPMIANMRIDGREPDNLDVTEDEPTPERVAEVLAEMERHK